jgi:hypothetical protein
MEYALGRTGKAINVMDTALCIGGTVPTAQLDVRGNLNFTGSLLQNGSAFQGSKWTTDGTGVKLAYTNVSRDCFIEVGRLRVHTVQSSAGSWEWVYGTILASGTYAGTSGQGYKDASPGIQLYRGRDLSGNYYWNTLIPAPGGTERTDAMDLGYPGTGRWRRIYGQSIYRVNEYGYSDDRIKTNETFVENATQTLLKLKPQTYDKHKFEYDHFTDDEYSNVSSNNTVFSAYSNCWVDKTEIIENTAVGGQFPYIRRRVSEQSQKETGLIAQDVWYDAPELRHIVDVSGDAAPAEEKPTDSGDPQQDPDYDSAGWGTGEASISYTQIIPVLIKSNQEIYTELQAEKAKVADLLARVTALENA